MKNVLVISGHPNLKERSLTNKVIVDQLEVQEGVTVRDIKSLYPDFKIDVKAEQAALLKADTIVLQFPFHWYSVPGILKEWIDRVLEYGFAYGSTGDKLKGKNLLISTTIGGPEDAYSSEGYNNYKIDDLLKPLIQTANLCGLKLHEPIVTHGMIYIPGVYGEAEDVKQKAEEHAERLVAALGKL
ncbi:MAG: NAD(P)H-dependent oxidoreductase [Deltaproteobacteria bacterium]|nr:NAD(P)H-dependent oxidoreductase [Deltaproteobacteria bacterium]